MYPYFIILGDEVSTYFISGAIGFMLTFFLVGRLLLDRLMYREYIRVLTVSFWGLLAGGKIFGIITGLLYNYQVSGKIDIIKAVMESGIVFFGGLLGYIIFLWLACKYKNKSFKRVSDIVAVGIPLFHSFGRIGCFFSGCCYGKRSDCFLAVPYRLGFEGVFEKRIPIQLYEAVFELFMFLLIYNLYKYKRNKAKNYNCLKIYVSVYCLWRLFAEHFRGDACRFVLSNGVSFSQIVAVCILLFIIFSKE